MRSHSTPAKAIALLGMLAFIGLGLGACNTVAGFGQDMQALGQAMTKSSGKGQSDKQADTTPQADRDRTPASPPGSEPDYTKPAPSDPKTIEPHTKY